MVQPAGRLPQNTYPNVSSSVQSWQYVGDGAINGSFSRGHMQLTEQWDITNPSVNLPTFAQEFLGYSLSFGPRLGINRSNPRQHPVCRNMYAASISGLQGLAPSGQFQQITLDGQAAVSNWALMRVTVNYETPPYHVRTNDAVSANTAQSIEYTRFTIINPQPEVQFLSREGGSYKWPNGSPDNANAIRGKIHIKQVTQNLRVEWINVPDQGLFTGTGSSNPNARPTNLDQYLGCVNSVNFLGYAAGTVLYLGYKLTPKTMPYFGNVAQLTSGVIPRSWDVQLEFSYFQPVGPNNQSGGHNYVISPSDKNWYLVTDAAGNMLYDAADINQIFVMVA